MTAYPIVQVLLLMKPVTFPLPMTSCVVFGQGNVLFTPNFHTVGAVLER